MFEPQLFQQAVAQREVFAQATDLQQVLLRPRRRRSIVHAPPSRPAIQWQATRLCSLPK